MSTLCTPVLFISSYRPHFMIKSPSLSKSEGPRSPSPPSVSWARRPNILGYKLQPEQHKFRQSFVSHGGLPGPGTILVSTATLPCWNVLESQRRYDLFYDSYVVVNFDLMTSLWSNYCNFSIEFWGSERKVEQVFLTVNLPNELGNTFWYKVRVRILKTEPADS